MAESQARFDPDAELPPPGSRWGAGAHSVLPYLTKSLQARPAAAGEPREGRPADARSGPAQRPPHSPAA